MIKRMFVIAALLSFLIVATESNAEMKITPDGVTSPDNSASLHLSGSYTTGSFYFDIDGPEGAVVSGLNSYNGISYSYGGYFAAVNSQYGIGVCGYASGSGGRGVYGCADSEDGRGVYGYASGNRGSGVYGHSSCSGDECRGVYGYADSDNGRGVYGYADSDNGRGVYGKATGVSAVGVFGNASNSGEEPQFGGYFSSGGTNGRGVYGYASGTNGRGVYGHGKEYDFYAAGLGVNYGPFTGAHEVKFAGDMTEEIVPGTIVSVTGRTEARKDNNGGISLSSTLPTVTLSTKTRDKNVFGVLVSQCRLPKDHWYETGEGERFGVVNALGEGRVWVTNGNGGIQAGDYITTSEIPGYGQRQGDDLLHSYTLGKAIEIIDWKQVTETVYHDGKAYKVYLIAVVYTSG